jgi:hypothetical protein
MTCIEKAAGIFALLPPVLIVSVERSDRTGGSVTPNVHLDAASAGMLHCGYCSGEARMSELLADIVSASGRELDAESRAKKRRYLEILRSAVRTETFRLTAWLTCSNFTTLILAIAAVGRFHQPEALGLDCLSMRRVGMDNRMNEIRRQSGHKVSDARG